MRVITTSGLGSAAVMSLALVVSGCWSPGGRQPEAGPTTHSPHSPLPTAGTKRATPGPAGSAVAEAARLPEGAYSEVTVVRAVEGGAGNAVLAVGGNGEVVTSTFPYRTDGKLGEFQLVLRTEAGNKVFSSHHSGAPRQVKSAAVNER